MYMSDKSEPNYRLCSLDGQSLFMLSFIGMIVKI